MRAQRGADAAAARALAQRRPVEGARAGDQGRADGRGRPVVTSPEEGGDAADVGGGGGGAGEEREPAPVGARRHRAQPAQGRGHQVGLHQRRLAGSPLLDQRTTRTGAASVPAERSVARARGCRARYGVSRRPAARSRWTVGTACRSAVTAPAGDVGQHHAGTPGLVDRGRLVDATDRAPRAHHDRAVHRAGVQRSRSAQGGVGTQGAGSGDPGAQDDPGVPHGAPGDHRTAQLRPSGDPHVAARQRGRGGADRGHPRRGVRGVRRAAGVAGGGDHHDVGLGRSEQRPLDGVEGRPARPPRRSARRPRRGWPGRSRSPGRPSRSRRHRGPARSSRPCRRPAGPAGRRRRRSPGTHPCRAPTRRRCRRRWRRPGCRGRCRRAGRGRRRRARCPRRSRRRTTAHPRPCGCRCPAPTPRPPGRSPWKPRGCRPRPGTPANSGLSGHRPESITPTTTPDPPRLRPTAVPGARRWVAARLRTAFSSTRATAGSAASWAACGGVRVDGVPVQGVGPAVHRRGGGADADQAGVLLRREPGACRDARERTVVAAEPGTAEGDEVERRARPPPRRPRAPGARARGRRGQSSARPRGCPPACRSTATARTSWPPSRARIAHCRPERRW